MVRPIQMAFFVSIVLHSSSTLGKVRRKFARSSVQPSGMSAPMPPTRVSDVVSRAPIQLSSIVYTRSRCWKIQRNGVNAEDLAALRDLDAEQPLRAEGEGDVVSRTVEVILAVRPGYDLVVLPILADLLEAAVQVADVRDAPHHRLAIQLEHQPEHAVRGRVLRADIDEHVLALELGLHGGGRVHGNQVPFAIGDERHALRATTRIEARGGQLDFD